MQDPMGQPRKAVQTACFIQVTHQGGDACGAQFFNPRRTGGQGHEVDAALQLTCSTHAHVAASDDQDALATKSGWQGA
jgi:hypothetical protein